MSERILQKADFGWRYFHFIDKTTGTRINVVDHKTDIFGLEDDPYMTMIAKDPKESAVRFKGKPDVFWENDARNKTGEFDFIFENARFKGAVNGILQHEELNDIILHQDKTGRMSHWAVDVPFGKIVGELTTPEATKKIDGFMYQDRQWGDIMIQEWVKNWTWAHLANENRFVVIFCINAKNRQKSWHAISGVGQSVALDYDFNVSHFDTLNRHSNPSTESTLAEIEIPGKVSVAFSLQPQNVMRSRLNEEHGNFSASYVRWSVNEIPNNNNLEGYMSGVAEYMKVDKK